jgi:hypothetical protein
MDAIDRAVSRTLVDATPPELPKVPNPNAQPDITSAHDRLLDEGARLFAQNRTGSLPVRTDATSTQPVPRFNDGIIYVGMNSAVGDSTRRAQNKLEASNLGADSVAHSEDTADGADTIRVGARTLDLTTASGAREFAETLGLPPAQTTAIAAVIHDAGAGSRDELAGLAQRFAVAERGGSIASRIVLSGHCAGEEIYDGAGKDGRLKLSSVQDLAKAMPKAAAHIAHVMMSACSSGYDGEAGRTSLSSWRQCFPNLKTAWGYGGGTDYHSPTESQAVIHITSWREATAGHVEQLDGQKAIHDAHARHPGWGNPVMADNVATWSASQGYRKGK